MTVLLLLLLLRHCESSRNAALLELLLDAIADLEVPRDAELLRELLAVRQRAATTRRRSRPPPASPLMIRNSRLMMWNTWSYLA